MGSCELTFLPRAGIDTDLASHQHQKYQSILSALGCEIVTMPTHAGLADSVFVEDTAVVLDEIAVLCRPGAVSRRDEVPGIGRVLRQYRTLAAIQSPGTLDGGDVLRIGKVIYAGLSTRSNHEGIEQLRDIIAGYGYSMETVETTECLHLKSAVTAVAPGMLLINPDWVDRSSFRDFELIFVDGKEAHAANALRVKDSVIYPSSFPRTMEELVKRNIDVRPVDLSELQKAEGAVTCCSLIFSTD
jgi:dimethylargininase